MACFPTSHPETIEYMLIIKEINWARVRSVRAPGRAHQVGLGSRARHRQGITAQRADAAASVRTGRSAVSGEWRCAPFG